ELASFRIDTAEIVEGHGRAAVVVLLAIESQAFFERAPRRVEVPLIHGHDAERAQGAHLAALVAPLPANGERFLESRTSRRVVALVQLDRAQADERGGAPGVGAGPQRSAGPARSGRARSRGALEPRPFAAGARARRRPPATPSRRADSRDRRSSARTRRPARAP